MNMELDVNRIWKKQKELYQHFDDGRNVIGEFFLMKKMITNEISAISVRWLAIKNIGIDNFCVLFPSLTLF